MKFLHHIQLVLGFAFVFIQSSFAQVAGNLDPNFGTNGLANVNAFSNDEESCVASFSLSSGKIILMGDCDQGATGRDFALVRLLENGSLDQSFGDNGKRSYSYDNTVEANDVAFDGLVQPDGKYLIIGNTPKAASTTSGNQTLMMRFDANGNLDSTFGTGGKSVFDGNDGKTFAKAMMLQNDGKILVAGEYANDNTGDMLIMRFLGNGNIDNNFGTGGVAHIGSSDFKDEANDVIIDSNGKILLIGYNSTSNTSMVALARFNANGTPDLTFGNGDGLSIIDLGNGNAMGLRAAIQSDGKIVVACHQIINGKRHHTLIRLLSDGNLDTEFGSNGSTVFPLGDTNDFPSGTLIQPDGKLLVTGSTVINNQHHLAGIRFLKNGQPDNTFGNNGKVTKLVGSPALSRHAFLIPGNPSDGGLLISGNCPLANQGQNIGLIKIKLGNITTTTAELSDFTTLTLSPNPVIQDFQIHFTLQTEVVLSLHLYDQTGRLIHRFFDLQSYPANEYLESFSMPSNLDNGNYTLRLWDTNSAVTIPIILNK